MFIRTFFPLLVSEICVEFGPRIMKRPVMLIWVGSNEITELAIKQLVSYFNYIHQNKKELGCLYWILLDTSTNIGWYWRWRFIDAQTTKKLAERNSPLLNCNKKSKELLIRLIFTITLLLITNQNRSMSSPFLNKFHSTSLKVKETTVLISSSTFQLLLSTHQKMQRKSIESLLFPFTVF